MLPLGTCRVTCPRKRRTATLLLKVPVLLRLRNRSSSLRAEAVQRRNRKAGMLCLYKIMYVFGGVLCGCGHSV